MKREKKLPNAHEALRRRITVLTLGLWLLAMVLLTWAVAADMVERIEYKTPQYVTSLSDRSIDHKDESLQSLPGAMEAGMIDSLGLPYTWLDMDSLLPIMTESHGVGSKDWIWGKWDLYYGFEPTVAFFDENGEMLMSSGNYLSFVYTSEENWKNQNTEPMGHAYVDLDTLPGGVDTFGPILGKFATGSIGVNLFVPLMRMTGYFEGVQFHPVSVDRGALEYGFSRDTEELCRVDSLGMLSWENMLTLEDSADRDQVSIYAWLIDGILFDAAPVTVEGVRYENVSALLEVSEKKWGDFDSNSLIESVLMWSWGQEDAYGPYTFTLAVRYWPLMYAATRLGPAYLVSLALVLALLWLVLRQIRKNLTEPLERLAVMQKIGKPITPDAGWREVRELEAYAEEKRQALHEAKMEAAQLNTALEYAKNAEESRRQLVSNITHELKTPLAVIHGYAEGLQAGIAGEKREEYLTVILEETEKMDAMVLQMLDLSRLEAGRVRLSPERFSLLELTKRVAEKLTPMAQHRALTFEYLMAEDCEITADEARMEQVVTNLLTNAVKYSDEGGVIGIKLFSHGGEACFYVENPCKPLSKEALEKVWDSFYRADPSRTAPGTGLGLTIVRSIIELHGGTCIVRNTTLYDGDRVDTGVQFGFQIPA